jgi:predicted flap endonuclease-1-like 5' DNA nuclease
MYTSPGTWAESKLQRGGLEMSYPIIDIEGIGPKFTKMLKKVGVTQTKHLLDRGASKKGRKELAAESKLKETQILKWTNMADLMRIRGVGEEYSELLEVAGVDTVKELRNRKPENLHEAMAKVNTKKKLVRQLPGPKQVKNWVAHAKKLKPVLTY